MIILPPARTQDIVMQDLGNEIMLYDLTINKAFCLNETTSAVFRNCDGITTLADLKLKNKKLSDEIIFLTIDLLEKAQLLKNSEFPSPFKGLSRREVLRRVGLGSLVIFPVISTVIAPTSATAASGAACPDKLAPGVATNFQCNFGPRFPGTADDCNQIECFVDGSGALCCSGATHAVQDPLGGVNFFRCVCD